MIAISEKVIGFGIKFYILAGISGGLGWTVLARILEELSRVGPDGPKFG